MTEPECTRFFQSDKEGNTYVFALGTGCTGPTRLVRPGDEMIFNSTYNCQDWITESKPKLKYEESRLAKTCPGGVATSTQEFKPPLTEEGLVELSHKNFPWKL